MKELPTLFNQHSKNFPAEVIVIEKLVDSKWLACAIATKVARAFKIPPVLIFSKLRLPNGKISSILSVVNPDPKFFSMRSPEPNWLRQYFL